MIKSQRNRPIKKRSEQDINDFINNLTIGKSFTIKQNKEKWDFDAKNGTFDDLANAFSTLVFELQSKGLIPK